MLLCSLWRLALMRYLLLPPSDNNTYDTMKSTTIYENLGVFDVVIF